jgi:hypothetical protein
MMSAAEKASPSGPNPIQNIEDLVKIRITPNLQAALGNHLWTSALYVAIEAFRRFEFADPEIDSILADAKRVALLRDCRDRVFHPGLASERIQFFSPSESSQNDWIVDLHIAFVRFCRAHFADFGEDDRTAGA